MPSRATSTPLTVTVLAALWVGLGRSGIAGSGCDSGKLDLHRDLPADAVSWGCSVPTWTESTQRLPSIDTVFDPEPPRMICMDKSIPYNHSIPNSGAFRPVPAQSGEYLYCPPQRWLNNLHSGAIVLLHHPCTPLHERRLLSALGRSCLPGHIITPHPQLHTQRPIALVSWGRTLELATVASSEICDWLQTAQTTKHELNGVTQTKRYNLLLTRSAGLHQLEESTQVKNPVRRCCERTVSSLLGGATEATPSTKKERLKRNKVRNKSREIRAAIGEQEYNNKKHVTETKDSSFLSSRSSVTILRRIQNYNSTHGPPADPLLGKKSLSVPPVPEPTHQSKSFTSSATSLLFPNISKSPVQLDSLESGSQESRVKGPTAALQPAPKVAGPKHTSISTGHSTNPNPQNLAGRPEALAVAPKDEGTHSVRRKETDSVQGSMKEINLKNPTVNDRMKDNEVVDVKEREVESKPLDNMHTPKKSETSQLDSVSSPQSESQQRLQPEAHRSTDFRDCGGCRAGQRCKCTEGSGAEDPAAAGNAGLPRTLRTDEAVWAAAALGFLLVLLTLSVLHTRLYRHWRTMPSLYWRDPQQDYDSVADVIRRRLRNTKKRRKRGRRQECVLLPSSSSSDEPL